MAEPVFHESPPSICYSNAKILAPMVRISTLPFRLECLKYGADIVFSEEIIDKKLLNTKRIYNADFDIIEYVSIKDGSVVFSTNSEEKNKVVLQLGTADPQLALQAAMMLIDDIAAVDINMGCPKSFSTKGGMGAALLKTPKIAESILKTLTSNLHKPVTCKIRLLETIEETVEFAKMCESCGISALTIHLRTEKERPNHRAHWDLFNAVKTALSIPVIANGDLLTRNDIHAFQHHIGAVSLMFARGAMYDPTIFLGSSVDIPTKKKVVQDFIIQAIRCRSIFQSVKFIVLELLSQGSMSSYREVIEHCRSLRAICEAFDLECIYSTPKYNFDYVHSLQYYRDSIDEATECAA